VTDQVQKTLGPADLPEENPQITYVDVPEWGGRVGLCSPSSARCDQVQAAASIQGEELPDDPTPQQKADYRRRAMQNFHARTVALCLCDDAGNPWYADAIAGAEQLGSRKGEAPVIARIYRQARLLCPLTGDAVAAIEKNSDPLPESGSSGSSEPPAN
jgi:hypothetical protein